MRELILPEEYHKKTPFHLYKRLDFREGRYKEVIPFTVDRGGDFLLKRITFRYSGTGDIVEGIVPAFPARADNEAPYPSRTSAERRYVDLDVLTTGHAGTEIDPFSFEDMYINLGISVVDTCYLLRGSYEIVDIGFSVVHLNPNDTNNSFNAWSCELYGPWRLKNSLGNFLAQGRVRIADAVIYCGSSQFNLFDFIEAYGTIERIDVYNSYIVCDNLFPDALEGTTLNHVTGSLIACKTMVLYGTVFLDSLIYASLNLTGTGSMTNCGIHAVGFDDTFITLVNCFTGYILDILFNWDIARDNMPITPLVRGSVGSVPDGVFVGEGAPYTYYECGLWGYERYGIGTGWFNPEPVPIERINTDIVVSLRKMSSTFGYFEDISPKMLSSPCDNFDTEALTAALPVDQDIHGIVFSGGKRLSYKSFNWIVEDAATIVIDVKKVPERSTYPEYVDMVVEGYFLEKENGK